MTAIVTKEGKTRLKKGERTRRSILDATLRVIARQGLRNVTHRSVATEAGVQLSLTTYYFRDIHELIEQAFSYFCEQSRPGYLEVWEAVFEYLDTFSAAELRKTARRQQVCGELAARATDYLIDQIRNKPVGLAVEQIFFTEVRLAPALQQRAAEHRENLIAPLLQLCRYFNKKDPEVDAELLLDTLSRLEYQAMLTPVEQIDREQLMRLVRRQMGWAMGLKRA